MTSVVRCTRCNGKGRINEHRAAPNPIGSMLGGLLPSVRMTTVSVPCAQCGGSGRVHVKHSP